MAPENRAHRGEPLFRAGFCRGVAKGPGHRFSSTAQSELREDMADVVLDRFRTDEEAIADFEVGQAVADEVQHLPFTRRQRARRARARSAAGAQLPQQCRGPVGVRPRVEVREDCLGQPGILRRNLADRPSPEPAPTRDG